jgi:hypothetical protein
MHNLAAEASSSGFYAAKVEFDPHLGKRGGLFFIGGVTDLAMILKIKRPRRNLRLLPC